MAFTGAVLPAWGYYRDPPEFATVGTYFLCAGIAVIASQRAAPYLLARRGVPFILVFACSTACVGLVGLALACPPAAAGWRMLGLTVTAVAAGLLNNGLFHALSESYQRERSVTVATAGVLFGIGCMVATLFVAGTLYTYTVSSILLLMAVVPAMYAGLYANAGIPIVETPGNQPTFRQAFRDFRSPGAVMFALLLFFQFGNEWSLAG